MLFNSIEFWLFFIPVLAGVHLLGHRGQNRLLLLASYVFYGAWDWRFLGLIAASTLVDYIAAQYAAPDRTARTRKLAVTASVVFNLGVLATFKYFDFFVTSFADLFGLAPGTTNDLLLNVILPVGISFYTFQTLSYTIDVNRGKLASVKRFEDVALYVAFFPQLVAGPIERAAHFMPQITAPRQFDPSRVPSALYLILWGLFKKVVIADTVAHGVNLVFAHPDPVAAEVYVALFLFGVQIYCDFSGYSDIARGLARLMGFELMLNFNLPHIARNPSDYWRRWHISLSSWLRDYLYIPLGGNRHGAFNTYRNLFLTMLLGGLWHGARGTYVLWGAYHGLLLVLHRLMERGFADKDPVRKAGPAPRWRVWLDMALMSHCVFYSWLLFRSESIDQVGALTVALGNWSSLGEAVPLFVYYAPFALSLYAVEAVQARTGKLDLMRLMPTPLRAGLAGVMIGAVLMLNQAGESPFIYFQF